MDIQEYVDNMLKASRADRFANSDQLTLGEIISKIETILDSSTREVRPNVVFDFAYFRPTVLDSWRGLYAELALGYDERGETDAGEFLNELKSAVGKTFTGYKGGDFTMSRHTPVWVSNNGEACNTAVIEVVDDGYQIILMTGYRES